MLPKIDFTESLIKEYAKKIFGFAYSKTNNYQNAEDLSQDIIVVLCDQTIEDKGIENMDAFIYRICCYTWSKYLRKNKPQWEALNNINVFDYMKSNDDIEENLLKKELCEKLRQEIMYLSKTKREITIMFYYENISGKEISKILGIPASTVRWHLSQAKIDLKERIEMTEQNGIYKPIQLCVGHNGWVQNYEMDGLQSDVLIQNICWICQGKALTIEDIARTLGVAAVYLEDKIKKLLYMDYIKKVGLNKYQANFFIRNNEYQLANTKFLYENTLPLAVPIYNLLKDNLDKIKETKFMGADLNDNFLMWCLLTPVINSVQYDLSNKVIKEKNLKYSTPKRKDGSQHWVWASTTFLKTVRKSTDMDEEFKDFCLHSGGNGIRWEGDDKVHSLQCDLLMFGGWRDFELKDLKQLKRVHEIIKNNEVPNDYDKEAISNLVAKGYVEINNGIPKILVPYFENNNINDILQKEIDKYLDKSILIKPFYDYIDTMKNYIPSFVDENERNCLLSSYWPQYAIFWFLFKNGYLKEPTQAEKKCLCTVVWEK